MLTKHLLRIWGASLFALWLAACGGGGGGAEGAGGASPGGSGSTPTTFSARFDSARLDARGIDGSPTQLNFSATVPLNDPSACLATSADERFVLDVSGFLSAEKANLTLTVRGDLAPGNYSSEVLLHGYLDAACTREMPGSPVRVPLQIVVERGIQAPSSLSLTRVGGEPLPTVSSVLTLPPQATGALELSTIDAYGPITARLEGNTLVVTGREKPAGRYTANLVVTLISDPRHRRVIPVDYTASPPPGGEVAFAASPETLSATVVQGMTFSRRIQVTRPSWSSAPIHVQASPPTSAFRLVPVDDDEWDVTLDPVAAGAGSHALSLNFTLGATPDIPFTTTWAYIRVIVDAAFTVGRLGGEVSPGAAMTTLRFEAPVQTIDGLPARWTATTAAPELRLVRASGQTGSEALVVEVDASVLARPQLQHEFNLDVAIDRAGVPAQRVPLVLRNNTSLLAVASPATLVGSSGRVYVDGWFPQQDLSSLLGRLRITGATLDRASIVEDTRFVGTTSVLALDLSGATPGQAVELQDGNALAPSSLRLSTVRPLRDAAGFAELPFGHYRPGQFAPSTSSLYFAADGKGWRWAWDGSRWTLTEAAIAGLIDLAPAPDDSALWAADGTAVLTLDPLTLAVRERSVMVANVWQLAGQLDRVDALRPAGRKAMATSADGRAFATLVSANGYPGTGWICSPRDNLRAPVPWTQSPRICDGGMRPGGTIAGSSMYLVRSANGQALLTGGDEGWRNLYRASRRQWETMTVTPGERGRAFVALSDSGLRAVRDDGTLFEARLAPGGWLLTDSSVALGNLSELLPLTHRAAGFGLSGDGRIGIIYGVRTSGSGDAERAIDAKAWIVDLRAVTAGSLLSAPLLGTVAMQPLGCTAAFATGETCLHTATVTVAPGDRIAFLVGPRGVAAVALPEQDAAAASATSSRARVPTARGVR